MGPQHLNQTDQQLYPFTEAELARLAGYRNAVAAGFYTDACVIADTCDERDFRLDWLIDGCVEGYPFSHVELQRMATYKAAVAIGLYTDRPKGGIGQDPA